jgi:16S rRNA (cytidine1402-2'-O)-methyltransferase
LTHTAAHPLPGTLYVVATPIGNLADASPRALDVLRQAELVACEDTRTTRTLLARHGIERATLALHAPW